MKLETTEHPITFGNWGFLAFDSEHPLEPKTQAFGQTREEAIRNLTLKMAEFQVGDKVKIINCKALNGAVKKIESITLTSHSGIVYMLETWGAFRACNLELAI